MKKKSSELTNVYEELCSYENIEIAFERARKGKTKKIYVMDFEINLEENLKQLRDELFMQTYTPQPLKTFILRDPKTRKISKSDFRDRIIHHAICNVIESTFEKKFIYDSFANRIGKGTLNAIKRFDFFKRKVSKNNTIKCYVLKADIKSYFDNVQHNILLNLLEKSIKDERVMWLIRKILSNHQSNEIGKGMPLGNLTSQFFANVYLNELDQFVKHKLKTKYYIRYVDDFVILHKSKKMLEEYKKEIDHFLNEKLNLKLHPDKSQILKLEKGIGFLGFRVFYHHKILVKKNMRKIEKKMEQMKHQYKDEIIEREKIIEKLEGWLAYASYANTYKYRRHIIRKFDWFFPESHILKINDTKKNENIQKKINENNYPFSSQKTLQLLKKGMKVKQIADQRGIKESTVWDHFSKLIEYNQLSVYKILSQPKIKKVLVAITNQDDSLTEIYQKVNDKSISFNEINCVLSHFKSKNKKKSLCFLFKWYEKKYCRRKCSKVQKDDCHKKFEYFVSQNQKLEMNKKEFKAFFHDVLIFCNGKMNCNQY